MKDAVCISCAHWQPKQSPKGMAELGFAPCAIRSMGKWHTFSAIRPHECLTYSEATAEVREARQNYYAEKDAHGSHTKT